MSIRMPSAMEIQDVAESVIKARVSEIVQRHVKQAQEEISRELPGLIGNIVLKIQQEMSKNSPIEPRFSVHIHNAPGGTDA